MGSAKGLVRVAYAKTASVESARAEFAAAVADDQFKGKYYELTDEVKVLEDGRIRLKALSTHRMHEVGTLTFDLEGGESEIEWHDGDPDE